MAQKTLSELTTITEMSKEDTFLIESGGKMKRLSNSGNGCIIDLRNYRNAIISRQIRDTTIYNELLEALDANKVIYTYFPPVYGPDNAYYLVGDFGYQKDEESGDKFISIGNIRFYPTPGYSPSDLYQPVNLIPDIVDDNNNNNTQ